MKATFSLNCGRCQADALVGVRGRQFHVALHQFTAPGRPRAEDGLVAPAAPPMLKPRHQASRTTSSSFWCRRSHSESSGISQPETRTVMAGFGGQGGQGNEQAQSCQQQGQRATHAELQIR
ncbi:MAG: hypothetical protein IPO18_08970 [bacterium]|nr:hypothetical protein [bacterium]